jgi:hypothetical protein
VVCNITGKSAGVDESGIVVDMDDLLDSHYGTPTEVNVIKIQYSLAGMSAQFMWAATTPVAFANLSGDGEMCYRNIGGLPNTAGTGKTGDILMQTTGATSGDNYTIVLEMVKHYK